MRIRARVNLSPFEILFGRPPNLGVGPVTRPLPSTTVCDDAMLSYCRNLSTVLSQVSQTVKAALPATADKLLHPLQPGDWVVVKELRRKHWKSKRWQGPFQVLLVTHTAVKVAERATWIHASPCKKVPEPIDDFYPDIHQGRHAHHYQHARKDKNKSQQ